MIKEQYDNYINSINEYVQAQKQYEANQLLDQMIRETGTCPLQYVELALNADCFDRNTALKLTIERYYRSNLLKTNPQKRWDLLIAFNELIRDVHTSIMDIVYENLFITFLQYNNSTPNYNFSSFLDKRICVFSRAVSYLKFIAPILQYLPNYIYDIVILYDSPQDKSLLNEFGLEQSVIFYGDVDIQKYGALFIDQWFLSSHFRSVNLDHIKIISFSHGLDDGGYGEKRANLMITSSAYQHRNNARFDKSFIKKDELKNLNQIPFTDKLEYGVTGPFHVGKYLKYSTMGKKYLRQQLCDFMKINIPEDKPLLFFLEDEISHRGQLIVGLNKLAKYCTIIAKFLQQPQLKAVAIAPEIIIYPNDQMAPNLARVASDYVLCGFDSGSFITALMLGVPVLPYYTRYMRNVYSKDRLIYSFESKLKEYRQAYSCTVKFNIYKYWNWRFDILKTNLFLSAIIGEKYKKWYFANINALRQKILGKFSLDDAPKKAAEYLLKFAADGTLGADADYVFFRK